MVLFDPYRIEIFAECFQKWQHGSANSDCGNNYFIIRVLLHASKTMYIIIRDSIYVSAFEIQIRKKSIPLLIEIQFGVKLALCTNSIAGIDNRRIWIVLSGPLQSNAGTWLIDRMFKAVIDILQFRVFTVEKKPFFH